MVRIKVECNNHDDQQALYNALRSCAKVINVILVVDSAGRNEPGYFVEFEGENNVQLLPEDTADAEYEEANRGGK